MSDEIIKVLDDLSQRFGIAIDWTSANALPYLQLLTRKYVNYRLAMSAMELVIGTLLLVVAVKLVKVAKNQYHKAEAAGPYSYSDDGLLIAIVCCTVSAFVIFIDLFLIPSALGDIIACVTFPEKLILDELLQVLKSH